MAQIPNNTYEKHLEKLAEGLSDLANKDVITEELIASLDKVFTLIREGEEEQAKLASATRSRHKAARRLLLKILGSLGYNVFFLCALTLPITWLARMNTRDREFIEILRKWPALKAPHAFSDITIKLYEKYKEDLTHIATPFTLRRGWSEEEHQFQATSHSEFQGGTETEGMSEIIFHPDGVGGGEPTLEADIEDDEDAGEDLERLEAQEGPLTGMAFKLERMDAIQVLASSKVEVVLTMPRRREAKPFISFNISEQTALQFQSKRKQVVEF